MRRALVHLAVAVLLNAGPAVAQDDPSLLTIRRIYQTPEFVSQPFG